MAVKTVVLTHHFGGNAASVKRHQLYFEELGYNVIALTYSYNEPASRRSAMDIIRGMQRGVRSVWLEELQRALDSVSGDKVIYSFSFPSCTVLKLIAEVRRPDVRGWICDGGPFLQPWRCMGNYFRHDKPNQGVLRRFFSTLGGFIFLGGPQYVWQMRRWVSQIDSRFPILSVRAGLDDLVPVRAIEDVFAHREDLSLQILLLPEAEHMQGLRRFPEVFKPVISDFLTRCFITASSNRQ